MGRKKGQGSAPKGPGQGGPSRESYLTTLIAALLTIITGIILLILYARFFPPERPAKLGYVELKIFFGNENGKGLKSEKRGIKKGDLTAEAKEALKALLDGQYKDGLERTMPIGTRVLGLRINGGTAFVDMSREIIENHPGGSAAELQTVYSIVNTLTINFPEIKEVQLLVEGKKEKTLAGHIDITMPLGPDRKIVEG